MSTSMPLMSPPSLSHSYYLYLILYIDINKNSTWPWPRILQLYVPARYFPHVALFSPFVCAHPWNLRFAYNLLQFQRRSISICYKKHFPQAKLTWWVKIQAIGGGRGAEVWGYHDPLGLNTFVQGIPEKHGLFCCTRLYKQSSYILFVCNNMVWMP